MPTPSGFQFHLINHVSDAEYQLASEALDRALLRRIGLPEEVEVRGFENDINAMADKIKDLAKDFSLSTVIAVLPNIVLDASALYEKLAPKLGDSIERKEFITKVVRYVYRKNDPDLPYLIEPFETMVENMILDAVPQLLDNMEAKLNELVQKIAGFLK